MENKIIQILIDNNIPYVLKGPNVGKKAIVAINCPFCKDDDGHHLGILKGKTDYYFTCWKHHSHSGTLPALLSYLLHISILEAKDLLDENIFLESTNLLDKIEKMCYTTINKLEEEHKGVSDLEFLPTFRDFNSPIGYTSSPFVGYLEKRGFRYIDELTQYYRLRFSISKDGWENRLIIPFYLNKKLVSWIGRSIDPHTPLRYKNLAKEESVIHPKALLFNYDLLLKESKRDDMILYITEGVFDSMKMQWFSAYQVHSTAILTTSMSDEQMALLYNVAHNYKKILILLDKGAESQAILLADKLSFLPNVGLRFLSDDCPNDPGDMTEKQVIDFTWKEINEKS